MGQINVNYEERIVQGLDRIAAGRGLNRPDLLRAIAGEAIEAHDAGRLAFQTDDSPRIDGSLNALALQLREATIELDRAQRANQRHEKKLLDAFVGSEETVRAAQELLTARINDINRKSYQPFVMKLSEVQVAIDTLRDRLTQAQDAKLEVIAERLEAVRIEASTPRTHYSLVLGDDRMLSLGFLSLCSLAVGWLAILLFLMTASQFPLLGLPVAKRLLADTSLLCRMIDDRYGVRDCRVPKGVRKAEASR